MGPPSQVESIFFTALDKPTATERTIYLNQACGSDAELGRRVERLLKAHPQATEFLARPAIERHAITLIDATDAEMRLYDRARRRDPACHADAGNYQRENSGPVLAGLGRATRGTVVRTVCNSFRTDDRMYQE